MTEKICLVMVTHSDIYNIQSNYYILQLHAINISKHDNNYTYF